jgi:redox-sensitive bicupin YhaK (pirin superfamily)
MTAGGGVRRSEMNALRTDWTHVFQIWLRPSEAGLEHSNEQKRICAGERREGLRIVASRDGRGASLHIQQDALIYSALLYRGQHVVHALSEGRSAWLHVVQGELDLGGIILTMGDGVGVAAEHVVSLTARENAEILLLDLGEQLPRVFGEQLPRVAVQEKVWTRSPTNGQPLRRKKTGC